MPKQTSFQATEATQTQLAALRQAGYGTTTDIIRIAIDRMHQQETKTMSRTLSERMSEGLRDSIMDRTGADSWIVVVNDYTGKSKREILADLNEMFSDADQYANEELAADIFDAVNA